MGWLEFEFRERGGLIVSTVLHQHERVRAARRIPGRVEGIQDALRG